MQLGLARQARLRLEPRALPLRRVAEVRGGPGVLRARGAAAAARADRVGARLVRDRVDAHLGQPLLEVRVPVVLDLVVGALRQVRRDRRPPACTKRAADAMRSSEMNTERNLHQKLARVNNRSCGEG